jgi:hypothetical protein
MKLKLEIGEVDRGFLEKLDEKGAALQFLWGEPARKMFLPVLRSGDARPDKWPIYPSIDGVVGNKIFIGPNEGPNMTTRILDCLEGKVEMEQVPLLLAKMGTSYTEPVTHHRQVYGTFLRRCYEVLLEG